MNYTTSLQDITSEQLEGFFVGWPTCPTPDMHLKMLQRSYKVVLAVDHTTGRVVGFINAISDGVLSAYIPLLEVLPEYQKKGIGKKLMEIMIDQLKDLYMIDLLCDEKLQPYYKQIGLQYAQGMLIRNYKNQSGK